MRSDLPVRRHSKLYGSPAVESISCLHVAAKLKAAGFIGIEIDPHYCDVAQCQLRRRWAA